MAEDDPKEKSDQPQPANDKSGQKEKGEQTGQKDPNPPEQQQKKKRQAPLKLLVIGGLVLLITSARLASGSSYSGVGFELDVISAVVLGGTNLFGGDGTLLGTFFGTIILAVIGNGLILLQISPFYEQIIKGVILVIAIILNRGALRRAFKT